MATYNKFESYVEELAKGTHNWSAHTFKVQASNTAPDAAADAVEADLPADLAGGNGYTANGHTLDTVSLSRSGGTSKVTIADEVITATGSLGPMRYFPIFNDTPSSPADPLVMYYDYGSSITLATTETLTIDFDGSAGFWTMA